MIMKVIQWGGTEDRTYKNMQRKMPEGTEFALANSENFTRADVVILRDRNIFGPDEMNKAKNVKLIQLTGRNVQNVALQEATKRNIQVAMIHTAHSTGVAEHTMVLVLALAKKLFQANEAVRVVNKYPIRFHGVEGLNYSFAYNWVNLGGLMRLSGKTIGLLGLGAIGIEVAKLARAFDMNVLYWDKTPLRPDIERQLGIRFCEFSTLLRISDFVSLHLSLNNETTRIIGAKELSYMKTTAYFVNTARGLLVDEDALFHALQKKIIAGAALDVFATEPLPEDSPLLTVENLILTPHYASGFDSYEHSQEHIADCIVENIWLLSKGKPLVNVVNDLETCLNSYEIR